VPGGWQTKVNSRPIKGRFSAQEIGLLHVRMRQEYAALAAYFSAATAAYCL
jgi:hypothetical protein